jgi:hypothetical protein
MDDFHHPLIIFALILALFVGWFLNELWDEIVGRARDAADTTRGWVDEIVHVVGWCAVIAICIGGLGLWQGWWG